ncbi:MAG: sugar phosphate isomerase/epimerase [Bacteroidales bacterium]|jgi:sugar phosphate isomerase/epimerase|nr:sugar phosphate isomerase/epimerase [Bacteroidales bacterium]
MKSIVGKLCLVAIVATSIQAFAAPKNNSKFGGVQVGTITYSFRSMPDQSLPAYLDYIVNAGISSVELMGGTVENYLGIPGSSDAVRQWRTGLSMDKYKEVKKMFAKRGVKINVLKLGEANWSDEEIDYAFKACKAVGAQGISMEISEKTAKRMAPFAEKHKLFVILHNHGQPGDPNFSFDRVLAISPWMRLNFDAGHYYGATGDNPCNLIKRLHDKIVTIHMKDKTGPKDTPKDQNQVWGQGGTPVKEILQLLQKEKWKIECDIELEYSIPQGSDAVKEVAKCVAYCREALSN